MCQCVFKVAFHHTKVFLSKFFFSFSMYMTYVSKMLSLKKSHLPPAIVGFDNGGNLWSRQGNNTVKNLLCMLE